MVAIRRVRVDEAPVLRRLTQEGIARAAAARPAEGIRISESGLANLETHYRLGARHQDLITLVAEEDDEIVGFVTAEVTRSGNLPGIAGEIGDLYLDDRAGPEIAEALGAEAISVLRARGAETIVHLEDATHPDREPWATLGFEADVLRFSRYLEPAET